jgi:hypothetical protein
MGTLPREFAHLRDEVEREQGRRPPLPGERFRVLVGLIAALAGLVACAASFGPNLRLAIGFGLGFDLHGGLGLLVELGLGVVALVLVGTWLWTPTGRLFAVWASVAAFGALACVGALDYTLARVVVAISVDDPFPYAMGHRPVVVPSAALVGLWATFVLAVRETLRHVR